MYIVIKDKYTERYVYSLADPGGGQAPPPRPKSSIFLMLTNLKSVLERPPLGIYLCSVGDEPPLYRCYLKNNWEAFTWLGIFFRPLSEKPRGEMETNVPKKIENPWYLDISEKPRGGVQKDVPKKIENLWYLDISEKPRGGVQMNVWKKCENPWFLEILTPHPSYRYLAGQPSPPLGRKCSKSPRKVGNMSIEPPPWKPRGGVQMDMRKFF